MSGALRVTLGAKANSLFDVKLPTFASYKLDGWRALWQGLEFFTRNGKCIPNRALQQIAASHGIPPGYDGEIIVGDPFGEGVFSRTDKFCKTFKAPVPAEGVRFFVFDHAADPRCFADRNRALRDTPPFVVRLDQVLIENYADLEQFEAEAVALGYEGICCRKPTSPYKNGRSTLREQYLVKLKRYIDGEFRIVGAVEKRRNANPAFISETGYTKRSSHQDGKIPAGTLGALIVDWGGKTLRVGSGWDSATAADLWARFLRGDLLGDWATIRYSPPVRDLPRQPIFKAIRSDL